MTAYTHHYSPDTGRRMVPKQGQVLAKGGVTKPTKRRRSR